MAAKFSEKFDSFVIPGESVSVTVNGITYTATVEHDSDSASPDERNDGFWPSQDPNSAGYIGSKSKSTLARHTAHAKRVMKAWENDEWFYCGIVISASYGETVFMKHAASLWGIETNYPQANGKRNNSYLDDCANELLGEAIHAAEEALADIVQAACRGPR